MVGKKWSFHSDGDPKHRPGPLKYRWKDGDLKEDAFTLIRPCVSETSVTLDQTLGLSQ